MGIDNEKGGKRLQDKPPAQRPKVATRVEQDAEAVSAQAANARKVAGNEKVSEEENARETAEAKEKPASTVAPQLPLQRPPVEERSGQQNSGNGESQQRPPIPVRTPRRGGPRDRYIDKRQRKGAISLSVKDPPGLAAVNQSVFAQVARTGKTRGGLGILGDDPEDKLLERFGVLMQNLEASERRALQSVLRGLRRAIPDALDGLREELQFAEAIARQPQAALTHRELSKRFGANQPEFAENLRRFLGYFGEVRELALSNAIQVTEFQVADIFLKGGAPWTKLLAACWLGGPFGYVMNPAEDGQMRAVIEQVAAMYPTGMTMHQFMDGLMRAGIFVRAFGPTAQSAEIVYTNRSGDQFKLRLENGQLAVENLADEPGEPLEGFDEPDTAQVVDLANQIDSMN